MVFTYFVNVFTWYMIGSSNLSTTLAVLLGTLCCSMVSFEICPINRIILAFPTFVQLNKVKVRAVLPYAMCNNSHISCVLVIFCISTDCSARRRHNSSELCIYFPQAAARILTILRKNWILFRGELV